MADNFRSIVCSICLGDFNSPKIINCFHTFCKVCLASYIDKFAKKGSFDCPLCRCTIPVPDEGVNGFSTNFYINTNEPVKNKTFVPGCDETDKTTKALASLGDKILESMCVEHKKAIVFYCHECSLPLCSKCLLPQHKLHDYVDIDEVLEDAKLSLGKLKVELETMVSARHDHIQSLKEEITQVNTSCCVTCKDVDQFVQQVCIMVQHQGAVMKGELEGIGNEDTALLSSSVGRSEQMTVQHTASLDRISQFLGDKSVANVKQLFNCLSDIKSYIEQNNRQNLMIPTLTSTAFYKTATPENFWKILKLQCAELFVEPCSRNDFERVPIYHYLMNPDLEVDINKDIGRSLTKNTLLKYRGLEALVPMYDKEFYLGNTKWYLSVSKHRYSHMMWVSLFFNGTKGPALKSITARFTLKLVANNDAESSESRVTRGTKTFQPPLGLVTDSYDWTNVIDTRELQIPNNSFLDAKKRFQILTALTIISITFVE